VDSILTDQIKLIKKFLEMKENFMDMLFLKLEEQTPAVVKETVGVENF